MGWLVGGGWLGACDWLLLAAGLVLVMELSTASATRGPVSPLAVVVGASPAVDGWCGLRSTER